MPSHLWKCSNLGALSHAHLYTLHIIPFYYHLQSESLLSRFWAETETNRSTSNSNPRCNQKLEANHTMLRILRTISRHQLKDNFAISKISHCFLIPTLNGHIILGVLNHYPHLKVDIVRPWLFPISLFTRPSKFITKKPTTGCKVAHHHGPSLKKPIIINVISLQIPSEF